MVLSRAQGVPPFPVPVSRFRQPSSAALRISLDESDHSFSQSENQRRFAPRLTGVMPEPAKGQLEWAGTTISKAKNPPDRDTRTPSFPPSCHPSGTPRRLL